MLIDLLRHRTCGGKRSILQRAHHAITSVSEAREMSTQLLGRADNKSCWLLYFDLYGPETLSKGIDTGNGTHTLSTEIDKDATFGVPRMGMH